tara:strand:- start:197 stop:601 length:405 start_codon:yes stop_codon:yes gene_type:complete
MKQILLILIFSIFFCCSNHKKNNFQDLNGFWLIEKAIAPNGEKKIYKNVEEVDFFEIIGEKGYRKKVISSINSLNNFFSNNDTLFFSLNFKKNKVFFKYLRNDFNWEEELVKLNKKELMLMDSKGVIFVYKKYN